MTGVSAQSQELTGVGAQPQGVTKVGVWCTGDDWTRSRYHGQGCQGYKERLERTDTEDRHKTVKSKGREQRLVDGLLHSVATKLGQQQWRDTSVPLIASS